MAPPNKKMPAEMPAEIYCVHVCWAVEERVEVRAPSRQAQEQEIVMRLVSKPLAFLALFQSFFLWRALGKKIPPSQLIFQCARIGPTSTRFHARFNGAWIVGRGGVLAECFMLEGGGIRAAGSRSSSSECEIRLLYWSKLLRFVWLWLFAVLELFLDLLSSSLF